MHGGEVSLSVYAEGLAQEPRRRYEGKIRLICCMDPFLLPDMGSNSVAALGNLPPVESSDIVAYLVLQTNFRRPTTYTRQLLATMLPSVCWAPNNSRPTDPLMLTPTLSMVG